MKHQGEFWIGKGKDANIHGPRVKQPDKFKKVYVVPQEWARKRGLKLIEGLPKESKVKVGTLKSSNDLAVQSYMTSIKHSDALVNSLPHKTVKPLLRLLLKRNDGVRQHYHVKQMTTKNPYNYERAKQTYREKSEWLKSLPPEHLIKYVEEVTPPLSKGQRKIYTSFTVKDKVIKNPSNIWRDIKNKKKLKPSYDRIKDEEKRVSDMSLEDYDES